jgi:sterol desaturase/sphingolipid hydroxylase (fatty acid hydroxylase superfamily)
MDVISFLNQHLSPHELQLFKLCLWLVILVAIFSPLERLFALHPHKLFRKEVLTDLGYYFLNNLVLSVLLSVPLAIIAWGVHHLIPTGFIAAVASSPLWLRIAASMIVGEIGFYWGHRWSHEIPLLWRFHAIHHSAQHLDFLVSSRAHPIDLVFTRLCGLVPLYVLGLAAPIRGSAGLIPVLLILLSTVWGFFIHANIRWRFGPLEWLIATPAFHHWHHTNDGPAYINKNYSPLLPWIDTLFGTLYLPKHKQPDRYGIDEPLAPDIFGQLVHPFMIWRRDSPPAPSETAPIHIPAHTPDNTTAIAPYPQNSDSQTLSESEV